MERAYWVAWTQVNDIGPVLIKRLQGRFGSLGAAWQASPADLLTVDGIGLVTADRIDRLRSQLSPQKILDRYESQSLHFWTPADPDYPSLLWEIPDPPPLLYYRGPLRPNHASNLGLGMVGTRRPTPYGRRWTQRFSRCCSQQQITIISGMAMGIDTYAHQSCLDVQGQTIAVLGTGVDVIYPKSNEHLYQRILETGLIVSEYPDGTPPDRSHFPRRNRIIAGLSHATLVTEAPERSGALITADLAHGYGRPVYALPGGLDNPTSRGCLALISTGATIVMGEISLLSDLRRIGEGDAAGELVPPNSAPAQAEEPGLPDVKPQRVEPSPELISVKIDEALQPIFQAIPTEPITLDNLVKATQLDTSALLSGLLKLELADVIVCLPGGQYQRI